MSGVSVRNQNSQDRETQLFLEQERHEEYEQVLRHEHRLDHEREAKRHEEYVQVLKNEHRLNHEREAKRHEEFVQVLKNEHRLDHEREAKQHEEYEQMLKNEHRLDHAREAKRKEECDTIFLIPLGSNQRTDLIHSNEQRKEELNNQLRTTLQTETTRHEQRKSELNDKLRSALQIESTRYEQRKANLNDQLRSWLQTEITRHEHRKVKLNDQLRSALQTERTRHEERKTELNNQSRLRQQAEISTHGLTEDEVYPILISTSASASSSSSRSNDIASVKTIIEQELEKLIALDPDMANYDFEAAFMCPISASLMLDPVIVADSGNTYDRKEIERWFGTSDKDPLSSSVVNKNLVPNNLVRGQILELLQKLRNEATAGEEPRKRPRTDEIVEQPRKRHQL